MTNILTKADIENFAPELDISSYNDATISGMLSQAQQRAAAYCSVDGFEAIDVVDETDRALIDNFGNLRISTHRKPINSVASISLVKGSFSTSLTLQQSGQNLYQIPYPNNVIVFPNSYFYLTGTYLAGGASQLLTLKGAKVMHKISYNGGYATIPDDLKYAIMLYFRDAFARRYNIGNLNSFSQGSYSESYNTNSKGKSPFVSEAEDRLFNGGYARVEIF